MGIPQPGRISPGITTVAPGRAARQGKSVGDYFLDSLFSDIDSLELYAGVHIKVFDFHRLILPCDGIGAELTQATLKVLGAADLLFCLGLELLVGCEFEPIRNGA